MRKIYIQFRNAMHIVGFLTLAYWLIGKAEIIFSLGEKIALWVFLTALGFVAGHAYEGLRFMLFQEPTSKLDGNLSGIGFSLGTALVLFNNDIKFINVYMFYFCLALLVLDTAWAFYRKNKKK